MRAHTARLRSSFWAIPALVVLGGVVLSYLAEWADALLAEDASGWYLFGGGPEGARSVLETIAGSMMTFTGLVFSVTILVLQQASTQFSPRALRAFLEDRASKLTLGLFVGTFVYALLTLRTVRGTSEEMDVEAHVPSLSIWLAVILVMGCVAAFIVFIHHVAQSIRPTVVLHRIAERARASIDSLYPESVGEDLEEAEAVEVPSGVPQLVVPNPHRSGVIARVDEETLLEALSLGDAPPESTVFVRMLSRPGDYVLEHAPLFEVWGSGASRLDVGRLTAAVEVERDRDVAQDAAFGLRELLDVALRALSPSTNDPTTAVAAVDRVHDLLRRLVRRRFPSPLRRGRDGRAAVLLPRPQFDDYVRLAVDELRVFGASQSQFQLTRRLHAMIEDLLSLAPPFRRKELVRQRMLLDRAIARGFEDELDRPSAHET